jgi:hypothetical protein
MHSGIHACPGSLFCQLPPLTPFPPLKAAFCLRRILRLKHAIALSRLLSIFVATISDCICEVEIEKLYLDGKEHYEKQSFRVRDRPYKNFR